MFYMRPMSPLPFREEGYKMEGNYPSERAPSLPPLDHCSCCAGARRKKREGERHRKKRERRAGEGVLEEEEEEEGG